MATTRRVKRLNVEISVELHARLHAVIPNKLVRKVLEPFLEQLCILLDDESTRRAVLGGIITGAIGPRTLLTSMNETPQHGTDAQKTETVSD